jgi:O-antigen ligase
MSGLSYAVGVATLAGWALNGFGSWRLGRAQSIVAALLLYGAWFALSTATAISPSVAWGFFIELLKYALPVLVGITMLETERARRGMLWTIVLAMGYVGFEMNLEYVRGINIAGEGYGGMDNNCFAAALVTVLGPAVALTITSRSWVPRIAAAASALLILHTLLLTFSRGGFVGFVAVAVTAFVMMPKRPRYLVPLLAVLLVTIRFTGPELASRYSTIFAAPEERDGSAESRLDLWIDCLRVVQDYPLLGVGPGNWRVIASQYGWSEGKSAHSVWMETAAEMGLPGALLLLAFFGLPVIRLWPIARQRLTDSNRDETAMAAGVILAVVGFGVAGQFVSVPGLEVPYYLVMVAAAMLKHRQVDVAAVEHVAPATRSTVLAPAARARAAAPETRPPASVRPLSPAVAGPHPPDDSALVWPPPGGRRLSTN